MRQVVCVLSRSVWGSIVWGSMIVVLALCALPAAQGVAQTVVLPAPLPVVPVGGAVKVDCSHGGTIGNALSLNVGVPNLVIVVKGTCTENVLITRDDLTIKTDGVASAAIAAADNSRSAINLRGARRIVIDGVVPHGITVSGGAYGIVASRGSDLEVKNCTVTGASIVGIISSFSSLIWVDACSVTGNGFGVDAGNQASLAISNSTVSSNTFGGIIAMRSSYLRVGLDSSGTPIAKPVTISGNGGTGISITESSSAEIVGGTVENSAGANILVSGASSVQIGVGVGVTAGVTVRNGAGGIVVVGGNALVTNGTISNNTIGGVQAFEAGVIELRGSTAVTAPAAGTTPGAIVQLGSTLLMRDTASIVSATSDGIQASNNASVNINGNTVQGGAFGVNCFNTSPMTASAATLTGNLANVTGTAGASAGCNAFP